MKITQSYSLDEQHIATIKAVAKDHGDGSASAALRYIIDDWVARVRAEAAAQTPRPEAQERPSWTECEEVVTRDRRKREAQEQEREEGEDDGS